MGAILSCCGGSSPTKYEEFRDDPMQAERDRQARERAAAQAEARQKQFEQSAVGRAALKSVKDSKRVETRPGGGVSASDWIS